MWIYFFAAGLAVVTWSVGAPSDAVSFDGSINRTVTFTGTMRFMNIEGGCWVFQADDGKQYQPRGGRPELYKDGIRARITGVVMSGVTICMAGPTFHVEGAEIAVELWQPLK